MTHTDAKRTAAAFIGLYRGPDVSTDGGVITNPIGSTQNKTHARAFTFEIGQPAWSAANDRDKAASNDML
jgi:hypothetical protein